LVRRASAAEIEGELVDQVRAPLCQLEVVVGIRHGARAEAADRTEYEAGGAPWLGSNH
jgi:hypothetical protein